MKIESSALSVKGGEKEVRVLAQCEVRPDNTNFPSIHCEVDLTSRVDESVRQLFRDGFAKIEGSGVVEKHLEEIYG